MEKAQDCLAAPSPCPASGKRQPRTVKNTTTHLLWTAAAGLVLLAAFSATAVFFNSADVYHQHFFSIDRPLALAYNAARLGLGLLLLWSCLGLGLLLLDAVFPRMAEPGRDAPGGLDRMILGFFVGAALLGLLWYALGLFSLLKKPVALGIHAGVLLLTAPVLGRLLRRAADRTPETLARCGQILSGGPWALAGALSLWVMVLLALGATLADFGFNSLVPGGTHDVYSHYFPYMAQTLQNGTTLPWSGSDAWYHFYYTKSQGLFFAAGLLSDPLAPQIVSGVFLAMSGLCVYALLRTPLLPRHLALAGVVALHLAFLTNDEFASHQKNHIVMLGNLACLLWLCASLWRRASGFAQGWKDWRMPALCAVLGFACVMNAPSAFSIAQPFAGGLTVMALAVRSRRPAASSFAALAAGLGCGLLVTFAINYGLTGMAEINPFRFFWEHADLARFSKWVSPYLMVALDQGSNSEMGTVAALNLKSLFKARFYANIFKFKYAGGLFALTPLLAGALAGAICLRPRDASLNAVFRGLRETATPCLLFCALIVVLGLITRQEVSYARFTCFALVPMVILAVSFWQFLLSVPLLHPRRGAVLAGIFALTLAASCFSLARFRLGGDALAATGGFLSGRMSIGEQYRRLSVLWPAATEIREIIPKDARVRVMHIGMDTESMAPFASLETEISFAMRGRWHTAMFAPPEQARACLEAQGLRFFMLDASKPFFDLLVFSPLFQPASLERNFTVLWRKGDAFLLTFAPPDKTGVPSQDMRELLARWKDLLAFSQRRKPLRGLYERVRLIYEANGDSPAAIRIPPDLPPAQGWQ